MGSLAHSGAAVRLLGPIDAVSATGTVHAPASALRRTMLALFALRAGEVLTSDWLLEQVWAGSPPESGLRALRFHVSQLRRELPDDVSIETAAGGYRLSMPVSAVDVRRVEELAERARASSGEHAATVLDEALGTWRGAPFADAAPCPLLDDEAQRMAHLRTALREEYYAARLDAGEAAAIIPDLSKFAAEHPLQESLWSTLIKAQYAAGRQADALRSFERLRTVLAETAGLTPSRELQELQLLVLAQDRALDAPPPAESRPSGTVTFLFTDVVGSTQRWEHDASAMGELLARHDEVIRHAIVRHGGHLFSSAGDGFAAAFADPLAATGAAVEARIDLSLPVRMGLHTGTAHERNGNYYGPTLNRAARIMDAGHAGQILLSDATAALVRDKMLLEDLGEHRFAGIDTPLRVWQVGADPFAPLRSTPRPPMGGLPRTVSTFIGRADDVVELVERFTSEPFVTVLGPGGVGKTRLAIEAARVAALETRDGAVFVDLSGVTAPSGVPDAVASALGVVRSAGELDDATSRVIDVLRSVSAVVVLDNCEHVIEAAADLVSRCIEDCPNLQLVCTSREPLGIPGEWVWTVNVLDETSATELFVERALRADPSFSAAAEDVRALCARLDCLPLPIELAAARARGIGVRELHRRLDDRLSLLVGPRGAPERHQTVAATIDWSIRLLAPHERRLLAELSLFPTTFTLDAAEAVATMHADVIAPSVDALVAKSLLTPVVEGGRRWYRMLQLIRSRAAALLRDEPTAHDAETRFVDRVTAWAGEMRVAIEGPHPRDAARELTSHDADVRAAYELALAHSDEQRVVSLVASIGPRGFFGFGIVPESCEWSDRALAFQAGTPQQRAVLLTHAVSTTVDRVRIAALSEEVRSLEGADPGSRAFAAAQLGWVRMNDGDIEGALTLLNDELAKTIEADDAYWSLQLSLMVDTALRRIGWHDEALCVLDDFERRFGTGAAYDAGAIQYVRGLIHLARGELDSARADFQAALRAGGDVESWEVLCSGEGGLGELALCDGLWDIAVEHFRRAHDARLRTGDYVELLDLALCAFALAAGGRLVEARAALQEFRQRPRLDSRRLRVFATFAAAELARAEQDTATAAGKFQEVLAEDGAPALNWWYGVVHAATALAEMAEATGDLDQAADLRARAAAADPRPSIDKIIRATGAS